MYIILLSYLDNIEMEIDFISIDGRLFFMVCWVKLTFGLGILMKDIGMESISDFNDYGFAES